MIWSFLTAFPVIVLVVAGMVHVVELGRLAIATEQASFFAARGEFVDLGHQHNFSAKSLEEFSRLLQGDDETQEHLNFELEEPTEPSAIQTMSVTFESPNTLPLQNFLHTLTWSDGSELIPPLRLTGHTPVPLRLTHPTGEDE